MICLSFDIEEFDVPLEHNKQLPLDEQIAISAQGTEIILNLLAKQAVRATFFCTATFAQHRPALLHRMIDEGHEVASHGFYHSEFTIEHLASSKKVLEEITKQPVSGFRMARMMPVDEAEIAKAGYSYNSSLNPTFLPGRYNHFRSPRRPFMKDHVLQLPASVTPHLRIPLFWLAFHNFPPALYNRLCKQVLLRDNYLNIYFHPWEFTDLKKEKYGLPFYISKNSGEAMSKRLENFIAYLRNISSTKKDSTILTFQPLSALAKQWLP